MKHASIANCTSSSPELCLICENSGEGYRRTTGLLWVAVGLRVRGVDGQRATTQAQAQVPYHDLPASPRVQVGEPAITSFANYSSLRDQRFRRVQRFASTYCITQLTADSAHHLPYTGHAFYSWPLYRHVLRWARILYGW
jgi:hypothetical protein